MNQSPLRPIRPSTIEKICRNLIKGATVLKVTITHKHAHTNLQRRSLIHAMWNPESRIRATCMYLLINTFSSPPALRNNNEMAGLQNLAWIYVVPSSHYQRETSIIDHSLFYPCISAFFDIISSQWYLEKFSQSTTRLSVSHVLAEHVFTEFFFLGLRSLKPVFDGQKYSRESFPKWKLDRNLPHELNITTCLYPFTVVVSHVILSCHFVPLRSMERALYMKYKYILLQPAWPSAQVIL